MAEEEEVIILEEEDNPPETGEKGPSKEESKKRIDKKLYLLLGGVVLLLLLALTALILVLTRKEEPAAAIPDAKKLAEKIKASNRPSPKIATPSQIEKMIKKANILYERGDKKEALNLFEQIATYSASVSYYNLGVAQMRQGRYEEAIESFKKAIQKGENRAVSAINAAACALHLHDKKRFEYYLRLAEADLPDSYDSSLYGYLYALVNYYRGNYFEVLSAVNHPGTPHYAKELGALGTVAYTVFNRPEKAIGLIESGKAPDDPMTLGLLYARIGEFAMAAKHLQRALENGDEPHIAAKALALVQLKNLKPQQSAKLLRRLQTDFKIKEDRYYPIDVRLSPAVYEIGAAQKRFAAQRLTQPPDAYKLLFAFAPFKVFNATQTLNYIRKGNASIYVDEAPEATKYLSRSSSISHVNLLISRAIKAAIDHRLHRANRLLQEALKRYPNHSILHYNLGLTYAQLGNFAKAHEHFLRSYHLNTGNFLSGIFALMCESLIGKKIPQIEQFVSDDLRAVTDPTMPQKFDKALFAYYRGDLTTASKWLESGHDNRPVYLLLDLLLQAQSGRWEDAKRSALRLREQMPEDVMANLLYLKVAYKDLGLKRFSAAAIQYLKKHPLNLDAVFYGGSFTRVNYVALRHITGTLYPLRQEAKQRLLKEREDPIGIVETLALCDIYLKQFEEAYVQLNQLVDRYNQQDSRTLFLTAVAGIGAGHHATAVALLELAKLTDPGNLESRYALGLLYLEQGNLEAAAIQFSKIPDGLFRSTFFDFDVTGYVKKE